MWLLSGRDTDLEFGAQQVTHTCLTEIDFFTLWHLSSLTLVSRNFPIAVEQIIMSPCKTESD